MEKEVLQEIGKLYESINDINKRLNDYINIKIEKVQADIDYLAIMTGNYIDDSEEFANESLDSINKLANKIKKYYDSGAWSKQKVYNVVTKGVISPEDYKEITGEQYNQGGTTNP